MATSLMPPVGGGGGGSGITLAPIRGSASSGFFAAFAQQLAAGVQYSIQRRSADQARKEQYALEFIKARMNPDAPDSMVRGMIALQALAAGKKNALDFYTDAERLAPDQFKQLSAQAAALKHFRQNPRESIERSETSPFQAEQETLRGIAGASAEASPGSAEAPGQPGGGGMPGMPSVPIPGGSVPVPMGGGGAGGGAPTTAAPAGSPAAPGGGGGTSPQSLVQGPADASTNAANNLMSQIEQRAGGARQQVEGGRAAEAQRLLSNVPPTPEEYRTSRMKLTENMDPAFQRFTQTDEAFMGDLQAGVDRWVKEVGELAREVRAGTLDDARHFERLGIQYQGQVAIAREGEAAAGARQEDQQAFTAGQQRQQQAFEREMAGLRLGQQQQEDVRQAWGKYASTYTQVAGRQPSMTYQSAADRGKLTPQQIQTINTAWVNEYMQPVFAPDTGAGMNALEATGYRAGEPPNAAIRRAMTALKKAGYDDNQRLAAMRNMLSALALERSDALVGGGPLMRLPSGF